MIITVPTERVQSKGGAAYCARSLRLTACGLTDEDAKMELQKGIAAWCRSLNRAGLLEEAARRANLRIEGNGGEGVHIILAEMNGA